MPRTFVFAALALIALVSVLHAAESDAPKLKKVLFIGIDGTRFDALRAVKTPHLDKLVEHGIHADNCLILGDRYRKNNTISGPGWSSILTGVWADKHGVHDNSFKGKNYDEYPHLFALLKRQRPDAHTASFVTWKPIHEHVLRQADAAEAFEEQSHDYVKFDQQAADAAAKYAVTPGLDCLFFYIGQVDVAGHGHGFHPSVPQYIEAIERADAWSGRWSRRSSRASRMPTKIGWWWSPATTAAKGKGTATDTSRRRSSTVS
jgi:predicted AlkP superfamily pyrophosphatase or phosphodiesterase